MRLPEQRLWDRMRTRMKGRGVRLERVENLVAVGRPDVDALALGVFTPVELKAVDEWPARAATPVLGRKGLSQDQKNWHMDWARYGGRSLIIVGVGPSELFALDGSLHDQVNELTQAQMRAFARATNWDGVEAVLKGRA